MSDANVLGQRTRKVNIDYGLADRLNREVAEEKRKAELERIKNGKKTAEEPVKVEPKVSDIDSGFITLENIACMDASGEVIEKYTQLQVRKDIERDSGNKDIKTNQISFTPYNAAVHFENQGLFLPSFALTCNIIAALYANKSNAEIAKVLNQYKDKGNGTGWHAQNTLVNWGAKQIIHYPSKSDYTSTGGAADINKQRPRNLLSFNNKRFKDITLDEALNDSNYKDFLQNLTGLQNPEVLVDIGKYFGMAETRTWVSSDKDTKVAWLGCRNIYFNLYTNNSLAHYIAARGVRSVSKGDSQ